MSMLKTNAKMDKTLTSLRKHYGLETNAAVVQRAVALLKMASAMEHHDGAVMFVLPDGRNVKVMR